MAILPIEVKESGITQTDRKIKQLDASANKLTATNKKVQSSFDSVSESALQLTAAFGGLLIVDKLTSSYIKNADAMTNVNSKLKLVTNSTQELLDTQEKIFQISQKTRSEFTSNVDLYQKIAFSTKELNLAQKDMLFLTSQINKELLISGTTADGAATLITQLGQAFSNDFKGVAQELGTIRDQSSSLYQTILAGTNMTAEQFKKAAEKGELSSEIIINAIKNQAKQTDKNFGDIATVVEKAYGNIEKSTQRLVGQFDKFTGASQSLSDVLIGVSEFMDENSESIMENGKAVAYTAGTIGAIIAVQKTYQTVLALTTTTTTAYNIATNTSSTVTKRLSASQGLATISSKALSTAMKTIPYVAVAAGIYSIIDALLDSSKASDELNKSLDKTGQKLSELTKNQLEYRKVVLDEALHDAYMERQAAIVDASYQSFLESDKQHKLDLKNKDEAIAKFREIRQAVLDVNDAIKNYGKEQNNVTSTTTASSRKELSEEDIKLLKLENDARNQAAEAIANFNRANHEATIEAQQALEAYNKQVAETYDAYQKIVGSGYDVWITETGNKINALGASGELTNAQLLQIFETLEEERSIGLATDSLDETFEGMQSLLDMQISLAESGMDWSNSLTGVAGNISDISKALIKIDVGKLKFEKSDLKLQEDYAKSYLEASGDIGKQKEAELKFDNNKAKLTQSHLDAQIGAYASLAGSMAGAFEQGSAGAIAFTALQSALGIASSWAAIATAWALPFPANIPAAAMVAANVLPIIAQLGGSSGSGGGASSVSSTGQTYEQNREQIEAEYTPITDRLDRQIELLERLNLQGSASLAGITRADVGFERDYRLFLEDTFEAVRKSFDLRVIERQGFSAESFVAEMERIDDLINGELFTSQNVAAAASMSDAAKGFLNEDVLREGDNMLVFLAEASKSIYGQMALVDDIHANWGENIKETETYFANTLNEIFEITAEYANSMLDVMDELKDASETMKESYDDLTGSMRYETERLTQAFSEFDMIRGESSYAEYLEEQIAAIDALGEELDTDLIDLLLSEDPTRIAEQVAAIEALEEASGRVFEGGAEEALNYLESIELVAEAMARSRENIQSFADSFKTEEELTQDLANSIGVDLATNAEELASLFTQLAYDMDGLTDIELELLNANKDLIESNKELEKSKLEEYLNSVTQNISTLEASLTSLDSILNKFGEVFGGTGYSLNRFYDSMENTQALLASGDFNEYNKSLAETINASAILFKPEAFSSAEDMLLAQARAANQFESLEDTTLEQIDYLELIEKNTREQINAILLVVEALGQQVNKALFPYEDTVSSAYQSVLGREAESAGSTYWQESIASGNVAANEIGIAVGIAGVEKNEISRADYVTSLYEQGLGKTPTAAEIDYWVNSSTTPTDKLHEAFEIAAPEHGEKFTAFANGGFTGQGMGIIDATGQKVAGVVHEEEWVAPKWMVQNNQNLFNQLENARQRGSYANGGFTSDTIMQGNNPGVSDFQESMIKLEKMFREVTENGSTMNVRLVG